MTRITIRRAQFEDLAGVKLRSDFQARMRDWMLLHRPAVEEALLTEHSWAAVGQEGEVLAVAGILSDGGTWIFLDERLAERKADALAVIRASRDICTKFWRDTGVVPYSEPDPEVPEAPRVARALGFVDEGADKWALRLPS